ncbi:unnamed protein product [Adineta ricciae]|uniref:Fibronectin type-III domain-containing protein n=1 Tax=Adineta ricciae TaxID=249248 RepID=A0A814ITH7_ADIRI|nr:unnamed protein product [Adineta ricciae]CAF1195666.1 unnamed protein product [Adineta ricciae]
MSIDTSPVLAPMTLGRSFQLGMLYDFKTDMPVSDVSLWDDRLITNYVKAWLIPSSGYEIHAEDSLAKRLDLFQLDSDLKMSVLSGLVELTHSSKLIDDRKQGEHHRRFVMKYSVTTQQRELSTNHLSIHNAKYPQVIHERIATHLVTGILYGAEVYFVFNQAADSGESFTINERNLLELLQKLTTYQIFQNGKLYLTDNERKLARTLTCRYYGDLQLVSEPTTFEQVAHLFRRLPQLLEDRSIPKQVWLYPLHLLDRSSIGYRNFPHSKNDLVNRSVELFERLYRLEMKINGLKARTPYKPLLYQIHELLSLYSAAIGKFQIELKKQIKDLWIEFRQDGMNENIYRDFLNKMYIYPLNAKKTNNWIQSISEGVQKLVNFTDLLHNSVNIVVGNASVESPFVLRLIIHVLEKSDPFLNELFQFLHDANDQVIAPSTKINCWFNQDNFTSIRNKIALFCEFAQANSKNEDIQYIVEARYAEEFHMNKDVSIILYQNRTPTYFEIPSKPGRAKVTNISREVFTLTWSKPIYGSQSIKQYKVYNQLDGTQRWTVFHITDDDTLTTAISELPRGKYRFKIKGITLIGDTAESDASELIDMNEPKPSPPVMVAPPIPPHPTLLLALTQKTQPIVSAKTITDKKATLDVMPAWFEQVKPVPLERIRPPASFDKNSPTDVRTYQCLATYRSMKNKTKNIDFVVEPFKADVENTETLVVVLNELANQLGTRLTFTNSDFKYDDSAYRTACGVANLGSIHTFLASEGQFQTAKFTLHLNLDYDNLTATPETLQKFVVDSINDISSVVGCKKEFIRVFEVQRTQSAFLGFGICGPSLLETEAIAEQTKDRLNDPDVKERGGVFKYVIRENYDFKLEPVHVQLQLQEKDFDSKHNRKYDFAGTAKRGGKPYYFPEGWYRHALRVVDKYPEDKAWLKMDNSPGEWAVAYHGTNYSALKGVINHGLMHEFVTKDLCAAQAKKQNPSIPDVKGLYVATHCEGGAANYASTFTVKDSIGAHIDYKVVFQCRVQPGKFTEHTGPVIKGKAWRVFDEKAIRPYGLLLQEQKQNN